MQSESVADFIRALFDGLDGLIEVRPIEDRPGGKPISKARRWYSVDGLIEAMPKIVAECKRRGWAAFYGVLPRLAEGGGTADDAAPGRVVWVDVDFKDFDSDEQARESVADLPAQPSIVVSSGHGLHLYWLLSEEQEPAALSLMSDALQLRVGGDACFDVARILRLPGSWNVKRAPIEVTIERIDVGAVHHYEDLADLHADDMAHAKKRAEDRGRGAIDAAALEFGDVPDGLPDEVARVHERWPHIAGYFEGRGKSGGDLSGSGYDMTYCLALLTKGIEDPTTLLAALLARQVAAHRSPRARDMTRCVERAVALHASRPVQVPPQPGGSGGDEDSPGGYLGAHDAEVDTAFYRPILEHGDEPDIANRLMQDIGRQQNLASEGDRIYRYDEDVGTWAEVDQAWLRGELYRRYERAEIRTYKTDRKTGEVLEGAKPLHLSSRMAAGVVSVLRDKIERRRFLGLGQPVGVPFANGLVTVDGRIRPFERGDHIREGQRLRIEYDRQAICPEWIAVLGRIWPMGGEEFDLRVQALQEFFAAALFGLGPKFQKVLVLVGEGANGKSVVSKVLRAMFPASVCTAVPIQRMSDPYYTEMLLDSAVNVVGELPAADVYEASGFKDIVDGGQITARRIREAPITFSPRAAHLFATNTLPAVTDHSDGFWRRWLALDFPRQFLPTDEDYDPDIVEKLLGELPGIARWAVDGAARLIERKRYVDMEASEKVLDEWRCQSNSVAIFATEHLERDADHTIAAGAVYRMYSDWCSANGFKAVNLTNFGNRIKGLKFTKRRSAGLVVYEARFKLVDVAYQSRSGLDGRPW